MSSVEIRDQDSIGIRDFFRFRFRVFNWKPFYDTVKSDQLAAAPPLFLKFQIGDFEVDYEQ